MLHEKSQAIFGIECLIFIADKVVVGEASAPHEILKKALFVMFIISLNMIFRANKSIKVNNRFEKEEHTCYYSNFASCEGDSTGEKNLFSSINALREKNLPP